MSGEILSGGYFMPLVGDINVYVSFLSFASYKFTKRRLDGADFVVRHTKVSVLGQ